MSKKYDKRIAIIFLILSTIFIALVINTASSAPSSERAPTITNVDDSSVTTTSAKITFKLNQNDARTVVHYGTKMSALDQMSDWNNDTSSTRSITLSSLESGKTYYYSVYAYNSNDTSKSRHSATKTFKTAKNAATTNATNGTAPEITNISIAGITSSTANMSFSVNQSDARTIIHYGKTTSMTERSSQNNDISLQRKIMLSGLTDNKTYYYSIYAYNNTDQSYYSNSPRANFITNSSGNGTSGTNDTNGTNGTTPSNKTILPNTGNRVWDETKGMNTTYIWNSYSFSGFYYDLDTNLSTEELTIRNIKRTINKYDATYTTSPIEVNFEHSGFGKYQVIGFMAGKYFAGYTTNSSISNKKDMSAIAGGVLQKILIDDDTKRTVSVGGTLTLEDGYVLKMKEIDIGAGTGQIWTSLLKDGGEVDNNVVAGGDTYIYSKKIGSIDDLPIIAIHFDSVFRGRETNAVFVKGLFQLSESVDSIENGDEYGKMEISGVSRDRITMENRETIGLSSGDTIDLMGDLKIIVADSDTLRFALSVERSGDFEVRGTIYPVVKEWTPMNFGLNVGNTNIGFYYDLDEDIGTEKFRLESISGSSIPSGKLSYSTSPQEVSFAYSNFGKYQVVGFMANKYFAGYTSNSKPPNPSTSIGAKSAIAEGQLHKVLIDDEDKRTISVGSTLTLKDGYVLKPTDIDMSARTMLLSLLKDGSEVDSTPLSAGQTYVYTKKVGSVDDLPIIMVRFDSVFSGTEMQAAFIKGVFQISESVTSVKVGDKYGKMEVGSVSSSGINMNNDDSISLSSGSTTDVMGDVKFKVADSSQVRFYPYVLVTQDMMGNQLVIKAPSKATAGDTIVINVTAGKVPIEGVTISLDPGIGPIGNNTNKDGVTNVTIPIKTMGGTYNITATKLGYQKANKTIEIERYIAERLSINTPPTADQFETLSIQITSNNTNISGVIVVYDNTTIGTTNNNGIVTYSLSLDGIHNISASKDGYIPVTKDINVRAPYVEYRAKDISIIPNSTSEGQDIIVKSNVTNVGTKAGNESVDLIVNGTVANNKMISIGPKETKEINFAYKISVPEGNYTVGILGQEGQLEVKKSWMTTILIVALITLIGAVAIYMATSKDNKIAKFIEKYKKK